MPPPDPLCHHPQALDYAGGLGQSLLLHHVVEQEELQDDSSVLRRWEHLKPAACGRLTALRSLTSCVLHGDASQRGYNMCYAA